MNWIDFFDNLTVVTSDKVCQNGGFFTFDRNIYKKIFDDVDKSLNFSKNDTVLDMGCGNGELARFIIPRVNRVILAEGAQKVLDLARHNTEEFKNTGFALVDLNKDYNLGQLGRFEKILCYSVVHYLNNYQKFEEFLEKSISSLAPKGMLLVGDIPLAEKKAEYLAGRGKRFFSNLLGTAKHFFFKKMTAATISHIDAKVESNGGVVYTKEKIDKTLRTIGNNVDFKWVLENPKLPFFVSREHLLIIKN
jgi:cyclopropane fatty-acyl-phospholipid synthase-like methyltransferase